MRTLIVEDSRLARKELTDLLKAHNEIVIEAEAASAEEAYNILHEKDIDLIFLDINMPGKNGFELLEMLDDVPMVIFTTAYDEYAVKSFEYNTLDYLLKPVKPEALERAIAKAHKSLQQKPGQKEKKLERVFIKDSDKCWLVNLSDIIMFESEGNYSRVYFDNNKPLIYKSLNMIEERIDDEKFFRANRKQIINLNFIASVKVGIANTLKVIMKNSEVIELSRRSSQKLKSILSF